MAPVDARNGQNVTEAGEYVRVSAVDKAREEWRRLLQLPAIDGTTTVIPKAPAESPASKVYVRPMATFVLDDPYRPEPKIRMEMALTPVPGAPAVPGGELGLAAEHLTFSDLAVGERYRREHGDRVWTKTGENEADGFPVYSHGKVKVTRV